MAGAIKDVDGIDDVRQVNGVCFVVWELSIGRSVTTYRIVHRVVGSSIVFGELFIAIAVPTYTVSAGTTWLELSSALVQPVVSDALIKWPSVVASSSRL